MKIPKLPDDIALLFDYFTPRASQVVNWAPVARSLPKLVVRYGLSSGVTDLKKALTPFLHPMIEWTEAIQSPVSQTHAALKGADKEAVGQALLFIYFRQLQCPDGLFLDLRLSHFEKAADPLLWKPNAMWVRLAPEFRASLLHLYRGYYGSDDALFRTALAQLGLLGPGLKSSQEKQLVELLFSHFGKDQTTVRFSMKHFHRSFHDLFGFLLENKIQLPPDFLYLGLYLATLHLALESLGIPFNVRKAFEQAAVA